MFFSLCWVLLLSILGPQAPENLGTKIVTHDTSPGGVSEETLYIMADRRRIEFRHSVQRWNNDGSPEMQSELSSVFILRCDLGQSFLLRPKTKEYSSSPPKTVTPEQAARPTVGNSDIAETAKPTLRIETTTVDTGERKEMFGYVARHVVTTTKQTTLDGSNSQPSQRVKDGWYIDLDRSISCDPKPSPGGRRMGFVAVGSTQMPMDGPEFVDIGAREMGLPLKETQIFPMLTKFPDGTRKTYESLIESEVTVLERTALDSAIFEVPSEYKQVDQPAPD